MSFKYISPLFPSVVVGNILNMDNKKILKDLKKVNYIESNKHLNIKQATNFISKDLSILDNFSDLRESININVQNYIKQIFNSDLNFKYTNSWSTKIPNDCFSFYRNHTNSWLSGVYYPDDYKKFSITFENPLNTFWNIDGTVNKYEEHNSQKWNFPIKKNLLLIFPSYLKHSVDINKSKKDGYSIAFNIWPSGSFGTGDSRINLNG